MNGRGLPKLTI